MKKFLPHLAFIFAISLIPYGYNESWIDRRGYVTYHIDAHLKVEEFLPYLATSVVIIFFLWKFNYFTRNKS